MTFKSILAILAAVVGVVVILRIRGRGHLTEGTPSIEPVEQTPAVAA